VSFPCHGSFKSKSGARNVSIRNRLLKDGIDPTKMADHRRMFHVGQCLNADQRKHSDQSASNSEPE
jgi:hypothetical protein